MERVFEKYVEFLLNKNRNELGIDFVVINGGGGNAFVKDKDENRGDLEYIVKVVPVDLESGSIGFGFARLVVGE